MCSNRLITIDGHEDIVIGISGTSIVRNYGLSALVVSEGEM